MDTQGYEMNIIKHAPKALEHAKGLRLEMSLFEVYHGEALFRDVVNFLHEKGFTLHMVWETYFSRKINRQLQADGVFFKN